MTRTRTPADGARAHTPAPPRPGVSAATVPAVPVRGTVTTRQAGAES